MQVSKDCPHDFCFGFCERQARRPLSNGAVAERLEHVDHYEHMRVEVAQLLQFACSGGKREPESAMHSLGETLCPPCLRRHMSHKQIVKLEVG